MLARLLRTRFPIACLLAAAALILIPAAARAHDIPNDITVQAFVKPEANRLRLLIRVPLKAMRDVQFPELPQGVLDLSQIDTSLREGTTVWISNALEVFEGDRQLDSPQIAAVRVSLPSDTSFTSYEQALAHMSAAPLTNSIQLYWDQPMLDVLLEYPIQSDQSRFSIHPGFGRLGEHVVIALRFLPPGGAVRAFEFYGDPGLVRLDPRWYQAALRFVNLGFFHILGGTDHLLFLFCLVIPFRRLRALIPVITAFTVAHSITLIASAYNLAPSALWFPPLIEMLIAISILYMALENIAGITSVQHRWMVAFGFGLVHGFGFSFALRQTLQFAGTHLLASLLSFNIGVELGQLLMLIIFIPALDLLFRCVIPERMGTIILSALVAHTAWHWMIDRETVLRQYRFAWPALTAAFLESVVRWSILIVLLAALFWLLLGVILPWFGRGQEEKAARTP